VALIKRRFGVDAVTTSGEPGQFDVIADGKRVAARGGNWFTRSLGGGYPDLDTVVAQLEEHRASEANR
jgi:hypothetical protein